MTGPPPVAEPRQTTPLGAVLALTALASVGTGIFWNGTSFIAKYSYEFSQDRNLVLYVVMGGVYMLGAFNAGRIIRALEGRLSPRGVLAAVAAIQGAVCVLPVLARGEWALWVSAVVVTGLSALVWPVVESYLTAGRHGADMRRAIGRFNLVWAPAAALPLYLMAPLLESHGRWALGSFAAANLLVLVTLAWFPPRPGHHDPDVADAHIGAEYDLLRRSAQILLPLSYVIISAMIPIVPYRLQELDVPVAWQTPAGATWAAVRFVVFVAMWRFPFWHGRWGTLLGGALALTAGFALVVTAPRLWLMLAGLGLIGAGLGAIYYAALYYAMSVGRAAVEASGTFEGLIGAGYFVGPLVCLVGAWLGGGPVIVGVVWAILAVGGVPAARPYLHARRRRRGMLSAR